MRRRQLLVGMTASGFVGLSGCEAMGEHSQQPNAQQSFLLNKYYLDGVTEIGDYFIGYFAVLKFGQLSLCYGDTLHSSEFRGLRPGPSLNCGSSPVPSAEAVTWRHSELGVDGLWRPLSPPIKSQLLSTAEGQVGWSCLQPSSRVKLKTSDGSELQALGCCEYLSMTIPPWRLGMKELVWGRFVSEKNSVVWLKWSGEHQRRLLFWNGVRAAPQSIAHDQVVSNDFSVAISSDTTLRAGHLGSEILSKVPIVKKLAPVALLNVHEHKRLARGTLEARGGQYDKGWIIHETVVWPD